MEAFNWSLAMAPFLAKEEWFTAIIVSITIFYVALNGMWRLTECFKLV